jgi:subtilase family serine protease
MKLTSLVGAGVLLALSLNTQAAVNLPHQGMAAAAIQAAPAAAPVEFSVYLPLRNQKELDALIADLHDTKSPNYQHWLEPAEFLQRFGPTANDIAHVRASLAAKGFTILSTNAHGVHVRGSAATVAQAFGVSMHTRVENGRTHFMAKGEMRFPSELAAMSVRVMGLEGLPEHHVHARVTKQIEANPSNRYDDVGPYWFTDLKQAYDYPAYSKKTDGTGVSVAILMSDLLFPTDVADAFNHEKFTAISGVAAPSVTTVPIDGGGVENGDGSFEASLDVQQVLGGAPGANVTLVSIPDLSDTSIVDGYTYIVDSNKYDIVNSSFGECELEYTAAFNQGQDFTYILQQYHEIFQQGNAQGVTFVASSGDNGALLCPSADYGFGDENPVFGPGVSTPADDTDVTAVGGGNLLTASAPPSLNSAYVSENGFGDPLVPYDIFGVGVNVSGGYWGAGGGVSEIFRKPLYQILAPTGSWGWRTLPDVGMQVGGCPADISASCNATDSAAVVAYGVDFGGGYFGVIGTSVSSPEFVGALALYEQQLGKHHRMGNANYFLYAAAALQSLAGGPKAPAALQFYHRDIPGFDGLYNGGFPSKNYDYIYGNGSPDVRKLFGLRNYPAAGVPQTPTNP